MRIPRSLLVSLLLLVGCTAGTPFTAKRPSMFSIPEKPTCDKGYDAPVVAAHLGEAALLEVSGVVASPVNEGVLWMHNDSGDAARLFAISVDGAALGEIALPGVDARDFEDIAAAPCPDLSGPCVYVGDVGDNNHERDALAVYAVAEPEVSSTKPLAPGLTASFVWRFPIVPVPAANIEAFAVMPDASAMLFIEKAEEDARSFTYPAPWTPHEPFALHEVARFDPPGVDVPLGRLVTAADIHPSGKRLLLRTYTGVFEAKLDGATAAGAADVDALTFDEVFVGSIGEPQGEAVAYDESGTGIWTVSESPTKEPGQPMHLARCLP